MATLTINRLWTYTGLTGVVVAFGGILAAIAVAPWFTWTGHALSDLGDPARASSGFFNGGLIIAGLLGTAFGVRVLRGASGRIERAGVVVLTLAMADMALVGIFDVTHPWHFPVSLAFFAGMTYGWFLHGSGLAIAGQARRGVAIVWLGVLHTTVWVAWPATGLEGIAIPETAGAVLLAVWALDTTRRLADGTI